MALRLRGRLLLALSARQEDDPGHRGRHRRRSSARSLGDLLGARLLACFLPGITMLGLSTICSSERGGGRAPRTPAAGCAGDPVARLDAVVAVHQHLGLDDRDEARSLASAA